MWHAPFHPLRTRVQCGFRATINNACGPAFTCRAESPKRWRRAPADHEFMQAETKVQVFLFANSSPYPSVLLKCLALSEVLNFWDHKNVSICGVEAWSVSVGGRFSLRPGVPGSAGWKTPRS